MKKVHIVSYYTTAKKMHLAIFLCHTYYILNTMFVLGVFKILGVVSDIKKIKEMDVLYKHKVCCKLRLA